MYSILVSSLLVATSVSAAALKRNIASDTTTLAGAKITVNPTAQASAYTAGLGLSGSPPDSGNVTADSIRLVNFDGCSSMPGVSNAEAQIYSGWQQAQKIMAIQALKDGTVDFNTAGALDYLGAAGLNSPRQADMNTIFKNFATLTPAYWPFGWRVHVRCDDPYMLCSCGGTSNPFAYTANKDDESGLARINFCPRYFKTPSLNSVISTSKNLPAAQKFDMTRYWETQGHVWAHELMHIDWVTGAYGPAGRYGTNQHVTDMTIQFTDSAGRARRRKAYGPESAKILARWPRNTGDYTIQNADNLALFMTSQYVQSELGNAYPQYPIVGVAQPDRPPTTYGNMFVFDNSGGVKLNASDPLANAFTEGSGVGCTGDQDNLNPAPVVFSSFAPNSAYPSSYISSLSAAIASETWAPNAIMTAPQPTFTSIAGAAAPTSKPPASTTTTIPPPRTSTSTPAPPPHTSTSAPPPPPPAPSDICGAWYKVLFDHFEVYGKDFDAAKFGSDGSGLKHQIKGCGDLTKWSFKYLQNDPQGMQWYASGNLPIGTKACIGRAVVSAGGSGPDGCTGAG